MDKLKKLAGIYIVFLIQSLIFENIRIFSCPPDILISVTIVLAISSDIASAALMGGFAGLLTDVMYGGVFGIKTLMYMYLGLLVSLAVDKKSDNSPLIMGWICFVCIAIMEIVVTLLKSMFGYPSSVGFLTANIFVKGIFGAVFAFLYVLWITALYQVSPRNYLLPVCGMSSLLLILSFAQQKFLILMKSNLSTPSFTDDVFGVPKKSLPSPS